MLAGRRSDSGKSLRTLGETGCEAVTSHANSLMAAAKQERALPVRKETGSRGLEPSKGRVSLSTKR